MYFRLLNQNLFKPNLIKCHLNNVKSISSNTLRFHSSSSSETLQEIKESGFGSGTHAKFAHIPNDDSDRHSSNLATCTFRVADRPGNFFLLFY